MSLSAKLSIKLAELKQYKGFIKYFKNTSWLFAEKILRLFVGLFVGIWVARYLGPEQFGLFSYAQSFVALFATFATLGLNSIVVRELVKDPSKRDVLLGTSFVLKLIGATIVLSLLAFAVSVQENDALTNSLIFIIASSTIFQSFNVIDFYFQSKVLSKFVVFSNTFSLLISTIIKVLLLFNEAPLIAFAYVGLFDTFVHSCGFIYFYAKNHLSIFKWSFDVKMAKSLLKDSWPLIFSGIVVSMYMKVDQIMIKDMMGAEAVGQYAAAVRISEAWYFIPMVIAASLFPAIINAKKQSDMLYYARLQKLYDFMVWMGITIALPVTFFSDWAVGLLYGEQYSQAGSVLMIHIWAGVFVGLGVSASRWVVNEKFLQNALIRTTVGAILNIVLNYFLIKEIGIQGVAIATLISYFFVNYFSLSLYQKTRICFFQQTQAFNFIRIGRKLWE